MVAKKRKSKRTTLQDKYRVKKRVKDHKKKLKKGTLAGPMRFAKKQVDHIPNSWPYKKDLLEEIQRAKERMEVKKQELKQRRVELRAARRAGVIIEDQDQNGGMEIDESGPGKQNASNNDKLEKEEFVLDGGQNSRRAFLKDLRKVVESADVILHVLDARDPNGTRSSAIETMVFSDYRKKLVYVLNKSDLVPRNVLMGWLKFLRTMAPAIPFKSNTQNQKSNLGRAGGKVVSDNNDLLKTSQAVGSDELIGLLKNYCRLGDTKSTIAVGIVGFPNVGKSSLINSLMRVRAVGVSSMPGFTRSVQEVILDKNIRLLDSPGVVFAAGDSAATALRNCINVEAMDDVITPVQAILERCPPAYLMQLYAVARFKEDDATSFLALVARAQGKLKKGGIPNVDAAAKSVLHDWNSGRIKFYCKAPSESTNGNDKSEATVVAAFSEELNLKDLLKTEKKILDSLESQGAHEDEDDEEYVAMENQLLPNPDEDMSDESGGEEQEAVMETVKPNNPKKGTAKKKKGKAKASAAVPESYDFGDHF
jgi:nuclear GTP-binding protein